jgi:hypothetical protein
MLRRALYETKCNADSYEFTTAGVGELLRNLRPEMNRKIGFRATGPAIRL